MSDMVDHPKHYNQHPAGIEAIDVIEEFPFNIGTAMKHLWRAGLKTPDATEDLRKAVWYIRREISRLAKMQPQAMPEWEREYLERKEREEKRNG